MLRFKDNIWRYTSDIRFNYVLILFYGYGLGLSFNDNIYRIVSRVMFKDKY
jgi:hypothetical protein